MTQKYFEEMSNLFPQVGRRDRMSPKRLIGERIIGSIETVTKDWNGNKRSEASQYSKVSELLRLEPAAQPANDGDNSAEDDASYWGKYES